jgi:hypothetical protein
VVQSYGNGKETKIRQSDTIRSSPERLIEANADLFFRSERRKHLVYRRRRLIAHSPNCDIDWQTGPHNARDHIDRFGKEICKLVFNTPLLTSKHLPWPKIKRSNQPRHYDIDWEMQKRIEEKPSDRAGEQSDGNQHTAMQRHPPSAREASRKKGSDPDPNDNRQRQIFFITLISQPRRASGRQKLCTVPDRSTVFPSDREKGKKSPRTEEEQRDHCNIWN